MYLSNEELNFTMIILLLNSNSYMLSHLKYKISTKSSEKEIIYFLEKLQELSVRK